jgi:hypothetical protein
MTSAENVISDIVSLKIEPFTWLKFFGGLIVLFIIGLVAYNIASKGSGLINNQVESFLGGVI